MREQIDKKAIQKRSEQFGNPRNIRTNPKSSANLGERMRSVVMETTETCYRRLKSCSRNNSLIPLRCLSPCLGSACHSWGFIFWMLRCPTNTPSLWMRPGSVMKSIPVRVEWLWFSWLQATKKLTHDSYCWLKDWLLFQLWMCLAKLGGNLNDVLFLPLPVKMKGIKTTN